MNRRGREDWQGGEPLVYRDLAGGATYTAPYPADSTKIPRGCQECGRPMPTALTFDPETGHIEFWCRPCLRRAGAPG